MKRKVAAAWRHFDSEDDSDDNDNNDNDDDNDDDNDNGDDKNPTGEALGCCCS